MLFSNFLDNVPKIFSEFSDSLSIKRCYQSMPQQLKSLSSDRNASLDEGQGVAQAKHHNQNRTRWKGRRLYHKHQSDMSTTKRLPHQKIAHQRQQRTLMPHSFNVVILFFIVLLSLDQMTTVNGARSRDSFNSIYHNNNSVNNISNADSKDSVERATAYDANFVNKIGDELPIIDIEYFSNVTNDAEFEKFLSKIGSGNSGVRKMKHPPIYQNEFAVYIPNGVNMADSIAAKHGFTNMGQIGSLKNYYLFHHSHVSKRSLTHNEEHHGTLKAEPAVHWFQQQHEKVRKKRDYTNDFYNYQKFGLLRSIAPNSRIQYRQVGERVKEKKR